MFFSIKCKPIMKPFVEADKLVFHTEEDISLNHKKIRKASPSRMLSWKAVVSVMVTICIIN